MSRRTARRTGSSEVVRAAGAVVWRERAGRLEVALIHRPKYGDWSWPKGKLDPGEEVAAAAVREVAEESGHQVVLGVPLPSLRYQMPDGRTKLVRYWAARAVEDDPCLRARPPIEPADLTEIDDVVWVSSRTAAQTLTSRMDHGPLDAVSDLHARGRLDTRVTAVMRHGQAMSRSAWEGGESTRPLTDQGQAQAVAVVPVLSAFGVRELVSSPWERCTRSLEPYAQATGLPLETRPELTEKAHRQDPAAVTATVAELIAPPRGVVVSTHRPVLPDAFSAISRASRRWTLGRLPRSDPYLKTGEVLVAHTTRTERGRPRVVALERHRPTVEVE